MEIILNGILKAGSTNTIDVAHNIRTGVYNCFFGEIFYDASNRILSPGVATQKAFDVEHIIGPYKIANRSLVYPMPTWTEREEDFSHRTVEIVVIVLLIIAIINSAVWLVYLLINRSKKEIVASSPLFLACMLIGSIIIYASVFFWMPAHMSDAGCSIHVAFLMAGFMLLFGYVI